MTGFGNWTRSERDKAVVSSEPEDGWNDPANVDAYGGFMVCESIANDHVGHLITAAPDLLALAHQYVSDLKYPMDEDSRQRRIERAEAVIAKATGAA